MMIINTPVGIFSGGRWKCGELARAPLTAGLDHIIIIIRLNGFVFWLMIYSSWPFLITIYSLGSSWSDGHVHVHVTRTACSFRSHPILLTLESYAGKVDDVDDTIILLSNNASGFGNRLPILFPNPSHCRWFQNLDTYRVVRGSTVWSLVSGLVCKSPRAQDSSSIGVAAGSLDHASHACMADPRSVEEFLRVNMEGEIETMFDHGEMLEMLEMLGNLFSFDLQKEGKHRSSWLEGTRILS